MRRIAIVLAGAALAVALVVPNVAEAGGRHGHHRSSHGHHDGRYRHGYHRSGIWWPGGVHCGRGGCYGVFPGYWGFPYGYGGYWGGGFGCNFDYPCGPPFDEKCRSFRGAPAAGSRCEEKKVEPAPAAGTQPAPDQNAQPAPEQGQPPAPDQGTPPEPGPEEGQQPRPY